MLAARRLPPVLLASLAACSSSEPPTPDPCDAIEAPTLTWSAPEPTWDAEALEASLQLDAPVQGLSASSFIAQGARLAGLAGEGLQRNLRLEGLQPGTTVEVELKTPTEVSAVGCPAVRLQTPEPLRFSVPFEPWVLNEPVGWTPLPSRPSGPWFTERTDEVGLSEGVNAGRAMLVDFDGDGREDVVTLPVTEAPLTPRFFRNESEAGQVLFRDVTASSGMAEASIALLVFADLDGDGDMDAFAGTSFRSGVEHGGIWENTGAGRFEHRGLSGLDDGRASAQTFEEMAAASLADFDGDGHLDLYVGHWYPGSERGNGTPSGDRLYRGDGALGFTPVDLPEQTNPLTLEGNPLLFGVGRAAYGIAVADYDEDGDLDIFVNNYGAGRPALGSAPKYWDHNLLWKNGGNLDFVDVSVEAGVAATLRGIGGVEEEAPLEFNGQTWPSPIGGNGFGCQFADFDNDGDLDLVVGTIAHPDFRQSDRTMLHVNQGPPDYHFTEESAARGLEYYEDELHPVLLDVDGDGQMDLAMSRLRGGSKWRLYFQTPDHGFALTAVAETGVDIERPGPTLWLDADGDGDLDMLMPKGRLRYFENRVGDAFGHLQVRLQDASSTVGSRVFVRSSAGLQQRMISAGEGHYNTQQSRTLHFGLGTDTGAAAVRVKWPDGTETDLGTVRRDVHIRVERSGIVGGYALP